MQLSILISLYIIIPVACLVGTHRNNEPKNSVSRDSSSEIRGIGMLLIVFSHAIGNYVSTETFFFYSSAILGVSSCFMLSGYGLQKSFQSKENYLKGFLPTKFLRLILPYIVVYVIYILYRMILRTPPSLNEIGFELITLQMDGLLLWYLKIQLLCYLIFFVCYKFIPKKEFKIIAVILAMVAYVIIAWASGLVFTWYNTCMFFCVGILLACFEEKVLNVLKKPLCIIISIVMTIGTFGVIFMFGRMNIAWLIDNVYMLSFNVALLGLTQYLTGSILLKWLGKYSMEVYLIHLLLIEENPLGFYNEENGFSYLLLVALSIIIAVPICYLCNLIMKGVKKLIKV